VGETVAVRMALPLDNRRNFKGKLLACENGTLTIEVDGEQFNLPVSGIEKGNMVPTFE
ncbi:MAG: ribosome maturation factor RimP, partial [Chloroflexi bacterium]|nr:ribosome maturation factor RimP [Chloroflexota bacterium]